MAAKIKMVTVAEFVSAISAAKAHRFAGLCGCTAPKLTVKDRVSKEPWGVLFPSIDRANVRKIVHSAVLAGPDYVKMVINELAREGKAEGEYEPGRCWHEAVPGMPLLRRHKTTGELYFWAAYVQKVQRPDGTWLHLGPKARFVDISNGAEIDRSALVNFLDIDRTPTNQGVDEGREVIVRTYKMESIRSLTVNGVSYVPMTK